jgi:hypothetical protein
LGQARTVQELVRLVRTYRPKIVFISETRQSEDRIKNLRWRLGLKYCITHEGKGSGAGIALFWDESIQINLLSYGPRYFDVTVVDTPNSPNWRATFVYGEPKAAERHNMWSLIRRLKPNSTDPWLMIGDFNETMWQNEHFSATRRAERQMSNFRRVLSFCNLHDLGYRGPPWTFDNKQKGKKNVKARIDRGVASNSWSDRFPKATLTHVISSRSDHLPLLLNYLCLAVQEKRKGPQRYEVMWERDHTLQGTIETAWSHGRPCTSLQDLSTKLASTQEQLKEWSHKKFGSVNTRAKKLRKKLGLLWNQHQSQRRDEAIKKVTAELDEILLREELMWRQRSRVTWLKEGDRNTRYFHKKATWRQKKNCVNKLKGTNGMWVEDHEEIAKMTTEFFKELYTKDNTVNPSLILDKIHATVSQDMNEQLCKEFTETEISDALFQIGPLKAPGKDGLPACFYQRNWALLKADVIAAVKDFLLNGTIPEGINDTVIVLIPKGTNPEMLSDFRPISLCNVVYKVISKCLVNRLRPLLDGLISETQSAFISGRMITDNAILAFEGFHKIQHSNNPHNSHCAFKLDLSKAYDRVDWDFLQGALLKMGFCQPWVNWIMACVRSVRFAVRINGFVHETFVPSRGLRQGDPLSPYLFLFVADSLACLLRDEIDEGSISPLKIARNAPGLSNLMFADDCLLFFKASRIEAEAVMKASVFSKGLRVSC